MHWDYWTYRRQPLEFIVDIWEHMKAEGDVQAINNKPAPTRSRRR